MTAPMILKALANVQREIHAVGIGKTRDNKEQKFSFRGIDDALMAFAPLLTENNVLLAPSYANVSVDPRSTKSGGTTYNVRLEGTFTFWHIEDGSSHTVGPFFGEANDGQDKAISKATSIAERNMFFLTFVVPHEPAIGGDPDGISEEMADEPQYLDWKDAIRNALKLEELREVRKEMMKKFQGVVPEVLVNTYNERSATLKASA